MTVSNAPIALSHDAAPITRLPAVARAVDAFAVPLTVPPGLPADLAAVALAAARWDEEVRTFWHRFEKRSAFHRALGLGRTIGDAIRLQRAVRTRRIDEWLAAEAPSSDATAFARWRDAFFVRCDAIAALATEGLVASNLAMPEDGLLEMARRNPARICTMIAGRATVLGTLSMYGAVVLLLAREWDFVRHFAARQLRRAGVPLSVRTATRARDRLNATAGRTLLTHRHLEPLLAAYGALRERGVRGSAADAIVLSSLERAEATSGKPWKGLTRLYDVLVYSGLDPRSPQWPARFEEAMTSAVDYTHVPGREWIVRDYQVGKRLMQIDGKIAAGDRWAGLQQGRGSLATGYLRGGHERTEFGRRYSKPLAAFLDSMVVAEGADHQRHRRAFLPFFTPAAVLAHAPFVEATIASLLNDAMHVAQASDGAFDVRRDVAYHFPIRVICRVLELPAEDVPRVQLWAEAAVRAMDTDAGLSFETTIAGQRASDALREYLESKLAGARAGTFTGHVISTLARDITLSEAERVANLGVVIFAGFETTTGLLSKGVEALLRHPEQWAHLRDALVPDTPVVIDDVPVPDLDWRWLAWSSGQQTRPVDTERRDRLIALCARWPEAAARALAIEQQEQLLDAAIEELLRWTAPGTVVPLTASKDVTLPLESPITVKGCSYAAGAPLTIKRGETIAVAVDELNRRCPVGGGAFDRGDATRLDVTRTDNTTHLSFGLRHACIGAFLAKENAKRALEGLLRHFPDLELAGDPIPQEMELFSGLSSLPVRSRRVAADVAAASRRRI